LAEFTGATACYIGRVKKPNKKFSWQEIENQDENAHLQPDAKEHI
jgi:hypothetical protein